MSPNGSTFGTALFYSTSTTTSILYSYRVPPDLCLHSSLQSCARRYGYRLRLRSSLPLLSTLCSLLSTRTLFYFLSPLLTIRYSLRSTLYYMLPTLDSLLFTFSFSALLCLFRFRPDLPLAPPPSHSLSLHFITVRHLTYRQFTSPIITFHFTRLHFTLFHCTSLHLRFHLLR